MIREIPLSRHVIFVLACATVMALSHASAQEDESQSEFSILLRLQPELVSVSGSAAEAKGTDGVTVTDAWAGGSKNSGNFGALFINASQSIGSGFSVFSKLGLNVDMEGLKDSDAKNRDLFVGLASPIGRVYAGRMSPAYKDAGIGWDPLNATFMQSRGNLGRSGGAFGHGGYLDRSIGHQHQFGPARFSATISLDEKVAGDLTDNDDHAISAAVILPTGAFSFLAAYVDGSEYEGGPSDRDALKLGIRYSNGPWAAALMHEDRGRGLENGDILYATTSYRHEQWQFSANLGLFDDNQNVNDGTYFALAARYHLHNRVSAHAGIRQIDRDLTGKEMIAGLGLRFIFNTGNLIR